MKTPIRNRAVLAPMLLSVTAAALAQEELRQELRLRLDLPEAVSWTQAADRVVGQSYSREWVPSGRDADTARWLIAEQKVAAGDQDAEAFLESIYEMSDQACTAATHDAVEQIQVSAVHGAVGRTVCSRVVGTDYGAYYDRAVLVAGGFAYIVTSEIRIPPMIVDGVLSFGSAARPESAAAKAEFIAREEWSRSLVRDRIRIDEP